MADSTAPEFLKYNHLQNQHERLRGGSGVRWRGVRARSKKVTSLLHMIHTNSHHRQPAVHRISKSSGGERGAPPAVKAALPPSTQWRGQPRRPRRRRLPAAAAGSGAAVPRRAPAGVGRAVGQSRPDLPDLHDRGVLATRMVTVHTSQVPAKSQERGRAVGGQRPRQSHSQ